MLFRSDGGDEGGRVGGQGVDCAVREGEGGGGVGVAGDGVEGGGDEGVGLEVLGRRLAGALRLGWDGWEVRDLRRGIAISRPRSRWWWSRWTSRP